MQALGFSLAARLSAAFQGPKKTLTDIASLSAAPFGANSNRALGTFISLLLITGTLVFLLRKRTAAIINKFIAWIIRTEVAANLLLILLLAFFIWRPRFVIFIALMVGLAHLFSIPLWPGAAPARPTRGQLHSPFKAPACGQSQNEYRVLACCG
ncbi:hypothetical protein C8R44DRAFT_774031 [Mycena epipterygia]|nr:hypothetical protein C8R44DRAFT_774031 [Mycena epipterygia]